MKTAFQYIRKSTEEQSNFSISGQQMIIEDWAAKKGIRIVKTFIDDGYSAKDFNRPQWKELESTIVKSKPDFLIIMKYDRLIRNVIEGLSFVEKLEQKWKITLVSVMENYSIDIHDPYFFKHRADMFVDADFERRRISDRTKFGLWSGRTQGRFLGVAPYGYINGRDSDDKPIILIDPAKKKQIQDIFIDFNNGMPPVAILRKAKAAGFSMQGKEALKRILTNHTYAGLIKVRAYKDDQSKVVKGIHQPIVSEDVFFQSFYKIQESSKPVTLKLFDENLPLRGFLKCQHCDAPHTGAKCKGKLQYYHYYWCNSCRGKNFAAKKVHSDLEIILNSLSLSDQYVHAIQLETEKRLAETSKDRQIRLVKAKRDHADLNSKLNAVEQKYFADKISDETFQKWSETYKSDIHRHENIISDLKRDEKSLMALYSANLPKLLDLNYLYKSTMLEQKQELLRAIFPGCLTALDSGYRTPYMPNFFSLKHNTINGLVTIDKKKGQPNSMIAPVGDAAGNEIEHLLKTISMLTLVA